MAERKVYHVVPNRNGGWDVKPEGAARAIRHFPTKQPAIDMAKEMAKKAELGQVKIHREDGTIQTEHTYTKDPRNIPG